MAPEEEIPLPDLGDHMDGATFEQILEMDEDEEDREFSRSIVFGFFEQSESTFNQIQSALEDRDLETLSSLGHFLKGSSATLGLTHMKQSCEKIQHLGKGMDETGVTRKDEKYCVDKISSEFDALKREYSICEKGLRKYYAE